MRRTLAMSVAVAAIMAMTVSHEAEAQYIEGNHQVRAGFFIAPAATRYGITEESSGTTVRDTASGVGFGASGGLEWLRSGRLTLGIEFDIATAKGSRVIPDFTAPVKASADFTATLRGRLGFYARPDLVLYATGGVGALGTEIGDANNPGNVPKVSNTKIGGVVGGGIEWHRGSTILFAEYLHGHYGSLNVTLGADNYRYKVFTDTVRLGVKFKVGHDWKDDHRHPQHHDPLK